MAGCGRGVRRDLLFLFFFLTERGDGEMLFGGSRFGFAFLGECSEAGVVGSFRWDGCWRGLLGMGWMDCGGDEMR